MSDGPRPKRYLDLDLITRIPGDKPEAMEVVRRPLQPAPPNESGFTLDERLETELKEVAAETLDARNRERDELLTTATQLRVQGAAIAAREGTVLAQHVAEVGTPADQTEATAAYLSHLLTQADKGYNVFVRPAEDEEST